MLTRSATEFMMLKKIFICEINSLNSVVPRSPPSPAGGGGPFFFDLDRGKSKSICIGIRKAAKDLSVEVT